MIKHILQDTVERQLNQDRRVHGIDINYGSHFIMKELLVVKGQDAIIL